MCLLFLESQFLIILCMPHSDAKTICLINKVVCLSYKDQHNILLIVGSILVEFTQSRSATNGVTPSSLKPYGEQMAC